MTQQEQQMLQGLTDRVNQTPLSEKDPEAEQFLAQTLGRNPDALYILAQTVLVTQYGMEQAQKQITALKAQLDQTQQEQPQQHTSFLGNLLGGHADQQRQPPPPPPQYQQQPPYQPVQNYPQPYPMAPPQYGPPQYGPGGGGMFGGMGGMGGGSFLGTAMRTAGGVAAGALAFEGIESLMHGFGHGGGFGGGQSFGGFGGGQPEIINNYYDDGRQGGSGDLPRGLSPDIEDRRDNFADTTSDPNYGNDDPNSFADTDDSGADQDMGSDSGDSGGSDDSNS